MAGEVGFKLPTQNYPNLRITSSQVSGAGTGTVTSVTFTGDGTILSSTPSSAVTTSGTLTAALANASANTVLAGPNSGSAAAPTYRALTQKDLQAAFNPMSYTFAGGV